MISHLAKDPALISCDLAFQASPTAGTATTADPYPTNKTNPTSLFHHRVLHRLCRNMELKNVHRQSELSPQVT